MDIFDQLETKTRQGYLTAKQRIVFEGAIYHVTQRAPGKELLFIEDSDYLLFLKLLKMTAREFCLRVYAFALLSNHLHVLFEITEKNLSAAMNNLFKKYAEYFNEKYHRTGHVFCGRFRASVCYDEAYFFAISTYIHLNPCRAGLCVAPWDYRWSSIRLFTEPISETFIEYGRILSFVDTDIRGARQKYRALLQSLLQREKGEDFSANVCSAKRSVRRAVSVISEILKIGNGKRLDELVEQVKINKRPRSPQSLKARKHAVEQMLANGYSQKEICEMLDMGRATLYRIIKQ